MAFGRHSGVRYAAPLPLVFFACAGVIGLPAVGWGQFSAHPVVVDFEAGADTARTAITVRNHGRAPLQFRVYVGDFEQESDGSHRFLDAGAHPSSCAARLRAYPSELVIDPGQTRPVVAEMAPGSGTCWSVVWIETMAEAGGGVRVGQRIGVKVHAFEPGAAPTMRIEDVLVEAAGRDSAVVVLHVENPGRRPLRPEGRIELRTFEGEVVRSVPVEAFGLLPEHRREVRAAVGLEGLAPGRYLVIPILDYGGASLLAAQREFEVSG